MLALVKALKSQWPGINVYDTTAGREVIDLIQRQTIDSMSITKVNPEMDSIETTRAIPRPQYGRR